MKTFILVRHGTTAWVDKHILHGITDIPLNEAGLKQAREVAQVLKSVPASHLYTSPLTRSMQTAQAIGEQVHLQPVPMDGLIEMDFGWLEGKPFKDPTTQKLSPLVIFLDRYRHQFIRIVSGESAAHLRQRVLKDWQKIVEENHNEISIIVAHSAVLNHLFIHYFGKNFPKGAHYYSIRPCSISEITIDDAGKAQLVRMDDASHLSDYN